MAKIIHCEIFVIGAGGTGTYFLKEISSYLAVRYRQKTKIVVDGLYIFDGDIVEAKNLSRQTVFSENDVGCNKASVMAEKLNYRDWHDTKLSWQGFEEYVVPGCTLEKIIKEHSDYFKIIVGCVDNHAARLYLTDIALGQDNCLYIDTANGDNTTGEVVITPILKGKALSKFRKDIYPDILEDTKPVTEMSCEELNAVNPQHQFTNMESAAIATQAVCKFLEEGKADGGLVKFNRDTYVRRFIPLSV